VYLTSAPMLSASATHTPVGSLGHAAATYSDSSATSPAVDSSMQAEQAPLSPPYTPAHAPLPAVTSPTSHAGIPVSSTTSPHAQSSANLGQIRRLGARANSPRSTAAISGRVPANTSASSLPRSGSFSASQTSATLSVPPLLLEADVHSASQLPLSPSTSASTPASDASSDKGNKKPKSPQGSESKKDPDAKRRDGDRDGHEQGDREGDESGKGSDEGVGDSAL
jgi:hypothetical protein